VKKKKLKIGIIFVCKSEKMLRIFIAGGVTSNLFSALLPGFIGSKHLLYATVRKETSAERVKVLSEHGVHFITKEEGLTKTFDAVLWMSTHDDIEYLTELAQKVPTLAISSAAIMDYYLGKETEEQLNGYKRSKLALARVPHITTLIPGFYIEDVVTPNWASRGLHGDTTDKLFASQADATFDWNKGYSVTPKSVMIQVINEWLMHPETFPRNEPIIVCSDRVYRRWELREGSGFFGLSASCQPSNTLLRRWELREYDKMLGLDASSLQLPIPDEIYSKFPHATTADGKSITVTDGMVVLACGIAASQK
jgi:hypothetical protein